MLPQSCGGNLRELNSTLDHNNRYLPWARHNHLDNLKQSVMAGFQKRCNALDESIGSRDDQV
jgi:hypothetical protein